MWIRYVAACVFRLQTMLLQCQSICHLLFVSELLRSQDRFETPSSYPTRAGKSHQAKESYP
jgi:hypothetical protein